MANLKRVLLVDDDRLMLELTGKALERAGFSCLKALSAVKALAILENELPDIILSDYDMPEIDGFDFRLKVLADSRLKNIPFIFLTSFTDHDLMVRGLDLRAVDFITKNTPMKVIISKLDNLITTVRDEHERSLSELLKTAEGLNLRSIPSAAPLIDGYRADFFHQTVHGYPGGDFIDFIKAGQYTYCILGDVLSSGWDAWLFSFNYLSYFRSAVRLCIDGADFSTSSILEKINRVIFTDPVLAGVSVNVGLARIGHHSGDVVCSGAGSLPLLLVKNGDGRELITLDGPVPGSLSHAVYPEHTFRMTCGDRLIMASDGIVARNADQTANHEEFAVKIEELIRSGKELAGISNLFFDNKKAEGKPSDDRSLVLIEKT